jgi:hypothetical protein
MITASEWATVRVCTYGLGATIEPLQLITISFVQPVNTDYTLSFHGKVIYVFCCWIGYIWTTMLGSVLACGWYGTYHSNRAR